MSDPKPLASLSPQLLARKGGARPAMRPAMSALAMKAPVDADQDDLGWNDMGEPTTTARLSMPQIAIVPPVVVQITDCP